MTVTPITGKPFSIGEVSRLTGVPVRTIRFYSDEGVIAARRGAGGHRVFDAAAVNALLLVRRLRALGLGLRAITDVVSARVSIDDAVSAERAAVDAELAALAWRRSALVAVERATPGERAAQLALLTAVQDRRSAHDDLVSFWRGLFGGAISPELFDDFVQMTVPELSADPAPADLLAYAELVTLSRRPVVGVVLAKQIWRASRALIVDRRALVAGVAEACEMAVPLMVDDPAACPALDRFVAAHASARGEKDTPEFRRMLARGAGDDTGAVAERYWRVTGELTGASTVGAALTWLSGALVCSAT